MGSSLVGTTLKDDEIMHNFKINDKVYYDSFSGLIKGKLVAIDLDLRLRELPINPPIKYTIKITSRFNKVYKPGDFVETIRSRIIPRDKVYIRSGQYKIKSY